MILSRNHVYSIILLTAVWSILREQFSILVIAMGIVISIFCIWFCFRFLPQQKVTKINFLRLAIYPFYLIGQIYVYGIKVIKIILSDAKVDVVQIKTSLSNEFLRTVLANSITLTPGSISLELKEETITVLWLRKKEKGFQNTDNADELLKGNLERRLLKVEK